MKQDPSLKEAMPAIRSNRSDRDVSATLPGGNIGKTMANPIKITGFEQGVLNQLLENKLPKDLTDSFEQFLITLRVRLTLVAESGDNEQYAGQVALLGILKRTHELLLGGVQALIQGNKHVCAACFRGLVETLGAIAYCRDNPDRLQALLLGNGVRIGRLRNAANSRLKKTSADLSQLDEMVHPASASLLSGWFPWDARERIALIAVPSPQPSRPVMTEGLGQLLYLANLVCQDVEKYRRSQPIKHGKPIGRIFSRGMPPEPTERD